MFKTLTLATALTAVSAAPLLAAVEAHTTTELNLRADPGPRAEILAVMPQDAMVSVEACTATDWCKVTFDGAEGWAYSPYLINKTLPEPTVIYQNTTTMNVEEVKVDNEAADTTAGAAVGAVAASLLVGGPVAIAAGALIGAAGGAAAPADTTVTYVTQNPVETVYLNGEVVVGAGIPQEVEIYPIPDTEYAYVYVNDAPVLVTPEDRRIVYIVR